MSCTRSLCSIHALSYLSTSHLVYQRVSLPHHSSASGNARYSSTLSSATSAATRNCSNTFTCTSQRAACFAYSGRIRMSLNRSMPHAIKRFSLLYLGQCRSTCRTVCACHPDGYAGLILGTWTATSQVFSPITSVRIRNSTVVSAFDKPAYSLRGSCVQGVRHTAPLANPGSASCCLPSFPPG